MAKSKKSPEKTHKIDQSKIDQQTQWIQEWNIFPIKWVFAWTQSKEMISSQLYLNLQRALSPKEYFFTWNDSLFQKNNAQYNKQIYDLFQSYIVFDPDKLPQKFIELFDIDPYNSQIQTQLDHMFKTARLLDKTSARIVFVDNKVIIFRNEEKLIHTTWKLTQWEKKRSEIQTTFNTFSNIYDAIRSQYYTIQSSQEKQNDYKLLQKDILILAQEIQSLWYNNKDMEFKRKLNSIVSDISNATNFRVLGAKLQNLQEITFTNKSIDSSLLQWAKNKLSKRFQDLQKIIWIVQVQLNELENILTQYQTDLDLFLSQIQFTDIPFAIENYNKTYIRLEKKYWPISPFSRFHQWINTYQNDKKLFPKFLHYIQILFTTFKHEHQEKISSKTSQFDDFAQIKDNMKDIEGIVIKS